MGNCKICNKETNTVFRLNHFGLVIICKSCSMDIFNSVIKRIEGNQKENKIMKCHICNKKMQYVEKQKAYACNICSISRPANYMEGFWDGYNYIKERKII